MVPSAHIIQQDVSKALDEDVGLGDVTAWLLPSSCNIKATILSREPMVVCGQPWVNQVFYDLDPSIAIHWLVEEGSYLQDKATLCEIIGPCRPILTGERTALNFLQTLSGTATKTREYSLALQGTHTHLLDTRKTLPGLRYAQKYAVVCGGGYNHRMGLFDAFLIKENHIRAAGSITQAIMSARKMRADLMLEVEVENLTELEEALHVKPDRILLDNFSEDMMIQAVSMNQTYQCKLEVSGNITLDNIRKIAQLGVDFISVGALTKSVSAIDLSLLVQIVS